MTPVVVVVEAGEFAVVVVDVAVAVVVVVVAAGGGEGADPPASPAGTECDDDIEALARWRLYGEVVIFI